MINQELVEKIAQSFFTDDSYFVVEVIVKPDNRITVFIENETKLVTIGDCVSLSKYIESELNRDEEDFELEVSSAGADLPLRHPRQFIKHSGKQVTVLRKDGIRADGILVGIIEDSVVIENEEKVKIEGKNKKEIIKKQVTIPLHQIKETKRILNF